MGLHEGSSLILGGHQLSPFNLGLNDVAVNYRYDDRLHGHVVGEGRVNLLLEVRRLPHFAPSEGLPLDCGNHVVVSGILDKDMGE